MKQTIYIMVVGVILAVLISVGINSFLSKPTSGNSLGIAQVGQTETNTKWFAGGLYSGNNQQLSIDKSGNLITSGAIITPNLLQGSAVKAISTSSSTYTISAADACAYSSFKITPLSGALTITAPSSSTLFSTCLTSIGQFGDINVSVIATSTTFAAGAGGTLGYTSSSNVAAGKYAMMRILRDSLTTYKIFLINIPN